MVELLTLGIVVIPRINKVVHMDINTVENGIFLVSIDHIGYVIRGIGQNNILDCDTFDIRGCEVNSHESILIEPLWVI